MLTAKLAKNAKLKRKQRTDFRCFRNFRGLSLNGIASWLGSLLRNFPQLEYSSPLRGLPILKVAFNFLFGKGVVLVLVNCRKAILNSLGRFFKAELAVSITIEAC